MNFTNRRFSSPSICEHPSLEVVSSPMKKLTDPKQLMDFNMDLLDFQQAKNEEKSPRKYGVMARLPKPIKPVLQLPNLESHRFNLSQTKKWRPEEISKHLRSIYSDPGGLFSHSFLYVISTFQAVKMIPKKLIYPLKPSRLACKDRNSFINHLHLYRSPNHHRSIDHLTILASGDVSFGIRASYINSKAMEYEEDDLIMDAIMRRFEMNQSLLSKVPPDYGGGKEDELYEDYNLTKRAQQTPTVQKKGVSKDSAYTSNTLVFSSSSKNPEVYLSWEINMEKWLRSNNIPKEKKLSQAVPAFTGNAYKWWLKESSPSINNQPMVDWRDLKVRMYKDFAEKYQDKVDATSKFHCQATRRKVMSTPKPHTVPKPKKAHDHEPKEISSSVLTHQAGFKRSAQLNKVQPQPITTPLPELQKLQEMCQRLKETLEPKEENTSNQGTKGHDESIKEEPTKGSDILVPLELSNSVEEDHINQLRCFFAIISKATLRMAIPNTTHVDNPSKERDSEEGFQRDPPSQLSEGFDGGLETEGGEFRVVNQGVISVGGYG
ncbi:hypothetical protein F2Q69_00029861 [Brassica cretica]|uniref:Retrotransposon gag domain-containing protein n=1 Tax=Brassica cretica TaxID=69181 RepID=A0A8S9RT57_BRACR|nr:hypothetical protein F2Q69_00029861 [Brassica cretica]